MCMCRALVLTAHSMITTNWLEPQPPTLDQWTQRLSEQRNYNSGWTFVQRHGRLS